MKQLHLYNSVALSRNRALATSDAFWADFDAEQRPLNDVQYDNLHESVQRKPALATCTGGTGISQCRMAGFQTGMLSHCRIRINSGKG